MLPLILIGAAVLGYLWWSGRLPTHLLIPVILGVLGAIGAVKGAWPMALSGWGGAAFMIWRMGKVAREAPLKRTAELTAENRERAERLLALPATYSVEDVDAAYRSAAKLAHPDAGGSADQIAALTAARDLLRAHLKQG